MATKRSFQRELGIHSKKKKNVSAFTKVILRDSPQNISTRDTRETKNTPFIRVFFVVAHEVPLTVVPMPKASRRGLRRRKEG